MSTRGTERNFYTGIVVAMAIVVVIGFTRTFLLSSFFPEIHEFIPPEQVFQLHGVLFLLWMVLLLLQAMLIRGNRVALHRKLGVAGAMLAIAMVVVGLYATLIAASRPGGFIGIPVPAEQFLVVPFFDIVMFALFATWALLRRDDPQTHKRLMLFATIALLEAAFIRFPLDIMLAYAPVSSRLATLIFVIAIIAWDYISMKRLHRITLIATVLTIVVGAGRFLIMATPAWIGFARWLTGLVA